MPGDIHPLPDDIGAYVSGWVEEELSQYNRTYTRQLTMISSSTLSRWNHIS